MDKSLVFSLCRDMRGARLCLGRGWDDAECQVYFVHRRSASPALIKIVRSLGPDTSRTRTSCEGYNTRWSF